MDVTRQLVGDWSQMHTDPHFNNRGGCDCFCDTCLGERPGKFWNSPDYVCTCPECPGECDAPHEL